MMAAMMLPSAAPTVLLFARVARRRADLGVRRRLPARLDGYGLAAYAVYRGDPRGGAVVPGLG